MYIDAGELQDALDRAAQISDYYLLNCIGADDPARSVDNLIISCKAYLKKNIELLELELNKEESAVWGACIVSGSGELYEICVVQNLNYCWKRFVICKEVFHAILDAECYRNMSIGEHIDEITVAFPDNESKPSKPVVAEMLAEIAAMEFMFPFASRETELSAAKDSVNHLAIAEKYKIPRVFIEKYLSTSWMGVLLDFSNVKQNK